ncbi:hemerythrin-like metal-binding protein [Pseudodesulfovibrio mercurii]|uniref:Hemerythrin-like metal-binding protein n=1 Tax=Pseudodesulfovibrio mercurii TaxID=641491 RepID=F0JF19_9BACT|nr:bacteriohemerythrin [Pseudodesulfovibrio mercurii]EGB14820.1 hemerythrin-like metal-binding protein [Pseudodesulfovibrio mercurii]
MHQIEWHDSHSVGVPSIDEQHKRLVALTNRLFLAIMDETGETALGDVLDELADYAVYHFTHEEGLLHLHGYPDELLTEHRAEHAALTDQVHEYIERYREDPACLDLSVYVFLRDWTTEHMSRSDSKYSEFLQARAAE